MVVPPKHPKMIIFSRKTHGFVGETHHFRVHPHMVMHLPWLRKECFKDAEVVDLSPPNTDPLFVVTAVRKWYI